MRIMGMPSTQEPLAESRDGGERPSNKTNERQGACARLPSGARYAVALARTVGCGVFTPIGVGVENADVVREREMERAMALPRRPTPAMGATGTCSPAESVTPHV